MIKQTNHLKRHNEHEINMTLEIYFNNKRYNDAIAQFKRSIALKPSSSEYRYKLAKAYHAQGNLKDAENSS